MASFWVSILIFGAGHGKNGWKWIEIILVKFRDSRQSSWWFQPSWKNTSQIRSFFQGRGIFITHIWVATKPRNLLFWSNKTWPVGQLIHRINLFFKKRGQLFQVLRTHRRITSARLSWFPTDLSDVKAHTLSGLNQKTQPSFSLLSTWHWSAQMFFHVNFYLVPQKN